MAQVLRFFSPQGQRFLDTTLLAGYLILFGGAFLESAFSSPKEKQAAGIAAALAILSLGGGVGLTHKLLLPTSTKYHR